MARRGIRECDAKKILSARREEFFPEFVLHASAVSVRSGEELKEAARSHDFLNRSPLVVKPDMLFGKRGLNQLVFLKKERPGDFFLKDAVACIDGLINKEITLICGTKGVPDTFIVEPFYAHGKSSEYYLSFSSEREGDLIRISSQGGVHVEEHWDRVVEISIPPDLSSREEIHAAIAARLPREIENPEIFIDFTRSCLAFFRACFFSYLEFNPIVFHKREVFFLDVVAKVDDTAHFIARDLWGDLSFPEPFGAKKIHPVEKRIREWDENSGASLKFTLLNPEGRIWTLVAGGGASVVYADAIAKIWGAEEMANYGEYSGDPSTEETYLYTKSVLELMTGKKGEDKILIVGGSIANFTDVAATFDGIIRAFEEMHEAMKAVGTHIFVRRGGPNYEKGLQNIREAGERLGLPIETYGPEMPLTQIIERAKERTLVTP